jgi:hypothetical protein
MVRNTKNLLLALMVSTPCLTGAVEMAQRIKVVQVLQPTGRTCETYYSLHASDIACLKDVEFRRLFRVSYKFAGEVRVADLSWYPKEKFSVTADGTPIDPDTSNQFKTEHDRQN